MATKVPRPAATYRAARRNAARGSVWYRPENYWSKMGLRVFKRRSPITHVYLNRKRKPRLYIGPDL